MRCRQILMLAFATTILGACESDDDEPADKRLNGLTLCNELDPTTCIGAASNWPPDDEMRLAYLWKKACEQNRWTACTSLGVLYEEGRIVHKVAVRAAMHFTNACNGGDGEACFRLSRLYERGELGAGPFPSLAKELRAKACAKGDSRGCPDGGAVPEIAGVSPQERPGGLIHRPGNFKLYLGALLRRLVRKGNNLATRCQGDEGRACNDIGWAYQQGSSGFEKEPNRSAPFYSRACELKYARGCDNLGWVFQKGIGVERDDKRAFDAYVKACDGGDPNGCNNLGWLHRNGLGTKRDEVLAAPLFEKACDADNKFGCANLAWLYHYGRGVAKDLTKAESLYGRACALGYSDACDSATRIAR